MIKAMVTHPFPAESLEKFKDIEGYDFVFVKEPDAETLPGVEVMLGQPKIEAIQAAPQLKWLQITSAGVDHYVRHAEAFAGGVTLTSLSGAFGQSMSEFVLAMTLALYKQLPLYRDNQRAHIWRDMGRQRTPVGKNVLILGAGNIGSAAAKLFRPFGCRITGLRRVPRDVPPEFDDMITVEGLDAALENADIVVGALPDTKETHRLLDRRRLSLMKEDAIIINVGRGGLIDCDALCERLKDGKLLGAALDVHEPEPLPADHPLWDCPNAIVTPHITGGTFGHLQETENIMYDLCRENLARYRDGRPLLNAVDFATGYRATDNRY